MRHPVMPSHRLARVISRRGVRTANGFGRFSAVPWSTSNVTAFSYQSVNNPLAQFSVFEAREGRNQPKGQIMSESTKELVLSIRAKKAETEKAKQEEQARRERLTSEALMFFSCLDHCLAKWAGEFKEDSITASELPELLYESKPGLITMRAVGGLALYLNLRFDDEEIGIHYAHGPSEQNAKRGVWSFELKDNYGVLVDYRSSGARNWSYGAGSSFSDYIVDIVYEILRRSV